ncbi:hypothetical protein [Gymnodinialimonas hymeniacidonis]|uniref:hypothetical protein n=1 Tax=Gymnodinialimonas hymeniacidonis TaxID=3126508 RepID=UPI0034C6DE5F
MTEVFVLDGAEPFEFGTDQRAEVAAFARSVRCPENTTIAVRANFVGVDDPEFGAWHFFGLCPGDAPDGL